MKASGAAWVSSQANTGRICLRRETCQLLGEAKVRWYAKKAHLPSFPRNKIFIDQQVPLPTAFGVGTGQTTGSQGGNDADG